MLFIFNKLFYIELTLSMKHNYAMPPRQMIKQQCIFVGLQMH